MKALVIPQWIRESNLIEDIDDYKEDLRSCIAWKRLQRELYLHIPAILELHRNITKKQPFGQAGKLRNVWVIVGGSTCPTWTSVPRMLEEWIVRNREPETEQAIKTAHIWFEKIHPFVDGNGRTGRMIMNYQRQQIGLEPLCILASNRGEYYKWFR